MCGLECVGTIGETEGTIGETELLLYNMKHGTTVPLLRLSKDPFEEDFTDECKDEKMDNMLPLVITASNELCADTCFVPSAQIQVKGSTKNQRILMVVEQLSSALLTLIFLFQ